MGLRARRLGETMKRIFRIRLVAASFLIAIAAIAFSQEGTKQPLRLIQTIPLPNVKGRLDHMDVDVKGSACSLRAWKMAPLRWWTCWLASGCAASLDLGKRKEHCSSRN